MPSSVGPNTLRDDSLVFCYDLADTVNSYAGEPTTNYLTTALNPNSATKESFSGTVTENVELAPNGTYTAHRFQVDAGYTYHVLSIPANTTITYSVWIKSLDGNTYSNRNPYIWNYDNPTYGIVAQGTGGISPEWKKFSITYTTLAHQSTFSISYGSRDYNGLSGTYALWRPQLEYKSNSSAFVNGTRSVTQGLLDLTARNTINLSNVSFNQNSQLIFDGTDDYLSIGPSSQLNITNEVSIFAMIKINDASGWDGIFGTFSGGGFIHFQLYLGGINCYVYGPNAGYDRIDGARCNVTPGQWTEVGMTFGSNTLTLYINGVALPTRVLGNGDNISGTNSVSIGRVYDSDRVLGGEIAEVSVYNRELSPSEILSNFTIRKQIFNIPGIGNTSANFGISAKTIKNLNSAASTGYYWIKPPQLTNPIQAYCDMTTDGGGWTKFWWYNGKGWPAGLHALDYAFGTHNQGSDYGFQRLPQYLTKSNTELLAKDGAGNIYKWDFANGSETAQRVWNSFYSGTEGAWANVGTFNPTVLSGSFNAAAQDTWQYRVSEGVKSFLLDDDTCDCESSLNAGHAMCGTTGWTQDYAQPFNAYLRYGVDVLNGAGCNGPLPTNSLELYFREKN